MSIRNKLLLISIDKPHSKPKLPIRVNVDFSIKAAANKGGFLSSRLASYKQSLQPISPKRIPDQQNISPERSRERRRTSLQLLPKLHQYDFPIQQIPAEDRVEKGKKNMNKVMSMKILSDNKSKRRELRNGEPRDPIDNILLQMLADEGAVCNKKIIPLERSQEIRERLVFNRRSVEPRIETLLCEGKELSPNLEEVKTELRQLSCKKTRSSLNHCDYRLSRKSKKARELNGWDIEVPHDLYDF